MPVKRIGPQTGRSTFVVESEEVKNGRMKIGIVATFSTACMPSSSVAP
jgi:hypothetical protein